MVNEFKLITSDGYPISYLKYEHQKKCDKVLLVIPATGVKQSFYTKFAQNKMENGYIVYTFDYRGIGKSRDEDIPMKEFEAYVHDWAEKDLEGMVNLIFTNHQNEETYCLGHSIGGQLIGWTTNASKFDKIILFAVQSGYWRFWFALGIRKTIWMFSNWHILFPVMIFFFGYFPAKKLKMFEDLPRGAAAQWSGWGRKKNYLFTENRQSLENYKKIKTPILAICVTDDEFAPQNSIEWMLSKYINAKSKLMIIEPQNFGIKRMGHFGFFKSKSSTIWDLPFQKLDQWVKEEQY